jgi:hypothetical protein
MGPFSCSIIKLCAYYPELVPVKSFSAVCNLFQSDSDEELVSVVSLLATCLIFLGGISLWVKKLTNAKKTKQKVYIVNNDLVYALDIDVQLCPCLRNLNRWVVCELWCAISRRTSLIMYIWSRSVLHV